MAKINQFYHNRFIKYFLVIIVLIVIFIKTYYNNRESIKAQKEEVLMYSKEYDDILQNIEKDATKKEFERQNKTDVHAYKSDLEKKAERIERYKKAKQTQQQQQTIQYKKEISQFAKNEFIKQKKIIDKKNLNKNYKEINKKYYTALNEIKNNVKKFPKKHSKEKIKRGDVVYATIKIDLNSNEHLKKALTTPISNNIYKQLEKNKVPKQIIEQIKKRKILDAQDLLFKVGFKSNFYDQLIDKKIGDVLSVNYEDYATNTQTEMLKQAKLDHQKRIEFLKRHSPEDVEFVKDFYDKISFKYIVEIIDIVDNNTKNKFDLDNVLENNFDKMDEEVKENLKFEREFKEKLKNIESKYNLD